MTDRLDSCLYVAPNLGAATPIAEPGLAATTERHHMSIRLGPMATCLDPLGELNKRSDLLGAVIAMERGWPGSSHIRFAESVLKAGKRAWFYWPAEQAIECIDREALGTYWRLWTYCTADLVKRRLKGLVRPQLHDPGADVVERCSMALRELYSTAAPVAMPLSQAPSTSSRMAGNGVYLRTDYWVQLTSGGSYGHTCYVARELAAVTESFSCLMANRFDLLDEFGLHQVVMPAPSNSAAEIPLLNATWHYYPILKVAFGLRKPAYIYERLCPGNFAAALVSRDLGIPYILEYNGSEISMSRSFNGTSLEHELLFVRAEEAAFKQATVISVVSEALKESLIARKIDPAKIVVNPNGALRVADVKSAPTIRDERAVLCAPGDVPEFVEAVAALVEQPAVAAALGRNARQAVIDHFSWTRHVEHLWQFVRDQHAATATASSPDRVSTADAYKEQVQDQWNYNPVGTHYATKTEPHTLQWFKEIEEYRYGTYAPWMHSIMEFDQHSGHDVLEIGGGVGTDLSQFANHGARVTDVDLSAGHLALAKENFERRGLTGRFVHHDAETLPFPDQSFDLVYSNGVLHHTPNTTAVVQEIRRVLRPGGSAIIMMYAEHSIHYWRELVGRLGLERDLLENHSIGEIMSRYVELSQNDARPLVKVYSARRLKRMFKGFTNISVHKRQLLKSEVPGWASWIPHGTAERLMGWNVIIKARKPVS